MNPYRYVPLGNEVYVDQWGPGPPNYARLLGIAIGVIVAVVVVNSIYSVVMRAKGNEQRISCQTNLRDIGLAFAQYEQDYDTRLPLVAGAKQATYQQAYGWADAIKPYAYSDFQCPSEAHNRAINPMSRNYTDYWYNHHCSGVEQRDFYSSMETILCGDGNDGADQSDARYSLGGLPANWRTDESKPPSRHFGGADYLFADGHVRGLKPSVITNAAESQYTFAVTRPPFRVGH